jgi:hypothetical protein
MTVADPKSVAIFLKNTPGLGIHTYIFVCMDVCIYIYIYIYILMY